MPGSAGAPGVPLEWIPRFPTEDTTEVDLEEVADDEGSLSWGAAAEGSMSWGMAAEGSAELGSGSHGEGGSQGGSSLASHCPDSGEAGSSDVHGCGVATLPRPRLKAWKSQRARRQKWRKRQVPAALPPCHGKAPDGGPRVSEEASAATEAANRASLAGPGPCRLAEAAQSGAAHEPTTHEAAGECEDGGAQRACRRWAKTAARSRRGDDGREQASRPHRDDAYRAAAQAALSTTDGLGTRASPAALPGPPASASAQAARLRIVGLKSWLACGTPSDRSSRRGSSPLPVAGLAPDAGLLESAEQAAPSAPTSAPRHAFAPARRSLRGSQKLRFVAGSGGSPAAAAAPAEPDVASEGGAGEDSPQPAQDSPQPAQAPMEMDTAPDGGRGREEVPDLEDGRRQHELAGTEKAEQAQSLALIRLVVEWVQTVDLRSLASIRLVRARLDAALRAAHRSGVPECELAEAERSRCTLLRARLAAAALGAQSAEHDLAAVREARRDLLQAAGDAASCRCGARCRPPLIPRFACTADAVAAAPAASQVGQLLGQLDARIEDVSRSLRFVCCIRPLSQGEEDRGETLAARGMGEGRLEVKRAKRRTGHSSGTRSRGPIASDFQFDAVLDHASQGELFSACGDLVEPLLSGRNITVIACGEAGSGKTHALTGSPDQPGLAQRVLHEIDGRMRRDAHRLEHRVSASVLAVSESDAVDLMPDGGRRVGVSDEGVAVKRAVEADCRCAESLRKILSQLDTREGGRSHVLTLRIAVTDLRTGREAFRATQVRA